MVTGLWRARLAGGGQVVTRVNLSPAAKVRADGTFLRRERYTVRYRNGVAERYRVVFRGRTVAGGAVGTLRMQMTTHRGRARFPACDSGAVSWSARGIPPNLD